MSLGRFVILSFSEHILSTSYVQGGVGRHWDMVSLQAEPGEFSKSSKSTTVFSWFLYWNSCMLHLSIVVCLHTPEIIMSWIISVICFRKTTRLLDFKNRFCQALPPDTPFSKWFYWVLFGWTGHASRGPNDYINIMVQRSNFPRVPCSLVSRVRRL